MSIKKASQVTRRETLKFGAATGLAAAIAPFGAAVATTAPAPLESLKLFRKGDADYEAYRRSLVWNLYKPRRYPEVIVEARSPAEVIAAVRYARQQGLKVTARGTGHTRSASFMREGGMLIDTSKMTDVAVDPARKVATASPGVRAGVLTAALAKHGLFFPTTHDASVGIGGFVMSGGFGWCANRYGFAASNLLGIDVVTADGELIHSNDEQNPDFVWCARGAGPGMFGVVTRYYLRAHDMPKAVHQSTYALPNEAWREAMQWLWETCPNMSRDIEVYPFQNYKPGGNDSKLPPAMLVSAAAMSDSAAVADDALRIFESHPLVKKASIHKFAVPLDINGLFQFYGGMMVASYRYFIESAWTSASADAVIGAVGDVLDKPPNDLSYSLWLPFPHVKPIPNAAMSHVSNWCFYMIGLGRTEGEDETVRNWVLEGVRRMDPLSPGIMLNEEDLVARPVKNILTAENWAKYTALKAKYDPAGVFGGFRTRA
jgi:hypothetical protein